MIWSQPALEAVAHFVADRTGLTFDNRHDSVELAVRRAMAQAGEKDTTNYLQRLAHDKRLLDNLVSDLTVGETYFFREPEQFERIRREVLPEIRQQHGPEHVVRAWSAGCASGEEAYTLAMVFEELGLGRHFHVLATDISHKALASARRAVYSKWSLRGESGTDALPYLVRSGGAHQVIEAIRQRVTFATLNLALDVYPSFINGTWGMDLILCRNVLIYFDKVTVQNVARRLFQCLMEGGWLITASADPPLWDFAQFEVVATHQGIVYRRPKQGLGIRSQESGAMDQDLGFESDDDLHLAGRDVDVSEEPAAVSESGPVDTSLVEAPVVRGFHDVRLLADRDPSTALAQCAQLLLETPFSTELHFLHAMLLLDRGEVDKAIQAMRRVIYLDRSLAVAHFTLASMLLRRSDQDGARRGFRNAHKLCAGLPADAVLALGEGERAGRLAELAGAELALLEGDV